jgi:hypothetical protein
MNIYIEYQNYLASPKWQTVRAQVIQRAENKCYICGEAHPSNHVHHVFYRKNIFETKPEDCVVMCKMHHDMFHKINIKTTNIQEYGWRMMYRFKNQCLYGVKMHSEKKLTKNENKAVSRYKQIRDKIDVKKKQITLLESELANIRKKLTREQIQMI